MPNNQVISTSRTADLVTFTVKSEGEAIPATVSVQSISVWHELNRVSKARLVILDGSPSAQNFEVSETNLFIPGRKIEISAGYHSDEAEIFTGIVIKHAIKIREDGRSHLVIDCHHKAATLTKNRRSRYFYEKTEAEVWEYILQENEIDYEVEATSGALHQIMQFQSTDWDFIVTRAELNGMFLTQEAEKIIIAPPNFEQEAEETVVYGSSMLSFDAEIDAETQFSEVTGRTWDYSKTEVTAIEATQKNPVSPGNLSAVDLAAISGSKSSILRDSSKQQDEVLQQWTDSVLMRHELARIRGRAKFQGISRINPGKVIELQGLGNRFNGKAFISGVQHDISNGQWFSNVQFGISSESHAQRFEISEKPASEIIPPVHGLQIGIVTQIADDPEGDYRVKVNLPVIETEGQGLWARIATYGAGASRGIIVRPEIGDEVIVGFINDDPNNPVILGACNSNNLPAPIEPDDNNYEKGWVTKSQIRFIINDDEKSLNVLFPSGKAFVIDDDQGIIELKDENGNSLTMDSNGISIVSGKNIILKTSSGDLKFEGINWNASMQVGTKLESGAKAEFSASGSTTVKGGVVQIN